MGRLSSPNSLGERSRVKESLKASNAEQTVAIRVKTPSSSETGRADELCSRCSLLDVSRFCDEIRYDIWSGFVKELGALEEDSICSLCRLFNAVKAPRDGDSSNTKYYLCAVDTGLPALAPSIWGFHDTSWDWIRLERNALVVAQGKLVTGDFTQNGIQTWTQPDFEFQRRISPLRLQYMSSPTHERLIPARRIGNKRMKFGIIKAWIAKCKRKHKDCNTDDGKPKPKNVKLIDIRKRKVVIASEDSVYCALSYVWGPGSSEPSDLPVNGMLAKRLPQTIEDCFKVAKGIGLGYIWIDRYCIDQTNSEEQRTQINQMDLIYGNADVTIIDASSDNPNTGLHGISLPTSEQFKARVGQNELMSILADPRYSIRYSCWNQRAWTYQESFFSRRRLVFTEKQLYFECHLAAACETIDPIKDLERESGRLFSSVPLRTDIPCHTLVECLRHYLGRAMTYDSDILRAFTGVLNHFKYYDHTDSYYGIPLYQPAPLDDTDRWVRSKNLISGLCWIDQGPGSRRQMFPSWSWVGWYLSRSENSFTFRNSSNFRHIYEPKVFLESCDTSLEDFDDLNVYQNATLHPERYTRFIHLQVLVVPLLLRLGLTKRIDVVIFLNGESCRVALDTPYHDLEEAMQDVCNGSEDREVLGICVPYSNSPDESYFILVIQRTGDHFERLGYLKPENDQFLDWNLYRSLITRLITVRTIRLG